MNYPDLDPSVKAAPKKIGESLIPAKPHPCVKCGAIEKSKRGDCKPCKRKYSTNAYAANPEKIGKASAKWRKDNPEKNKESKAAWYATNSAKVNKKTSEYYEANKDAIKLQKQSYRLKNLKKIRARDAKYSEVNSDKQKARVDAWRLDNPDRVKINHQNRRARKANSRGSLSKGLIDKLFKLQKGLCTCCRLPLGENFHMDHILPLALGGLNEDGNIQLLRQRCNNQKSAKHPVDFMQERGYLL